MHIYFSGIGGTGIGPLAMVAQQAGFTVSGSDKQQSQYIDYLQAHGIRDIHIGQTSEQIAEVHTAQPIDWYVHTSALTLEQPDAPELRFCREHGIKTSKRDEFLNHILEEKQLKLIAIAGTHGKTTTTAMMVWLFMQLGLPVSYILPAKTSYADMGHFNPAAEFFVYECDEFDRNFLAFHPYISVITGIDWTTRNNIRHVKPIKQPSVSFWARVVARYYGKVTSTASVYRRMAEGWYLTTATGQLISFSFWAA